MTAGYVELRCRSAFSFLARRLAARGPRRARGGARLRRARARRPRRRLRRAALLHRRRDARACARSSAPRSTVADAGALWLLVEDRAGYRNLCRLLTAGRARARRRATARVDVGAGRGARGGTLLPRRRRRGAARRARDGRARISIACGASSPIGSPSTCSAISSATASALARRLADLAARARRARRRHQRRAPRDARPTARCSTCSPASGTAPRSTGRAPPAGERRAPSQVARARWRRCSATGRTRSARAVASPSAAPSRSPTSAIASPTIRCRPARRRIELPPRAHRRRRARALAARSRRASARQLEHELALIEKLDLAGYFLIVWDIVALLPRARHPLPGPRLGRQQRGLLRARHHRRRCRRHGAALRALPLRGARRVARHRPRPAVAAIGARRSSSTSTGATATRGAAHDRERHHLPHAQRRARGRQGARPRRSSRSTGWRSCCARTAGRDHHDELRGAARATAASIPTAPRVALLVELVRQIQGLPRHLGQHSGGMVIAAGRLDEVVPLEPASMPGRVVVQWDKDDCADLGIIKVDLLGLGMMAALEEAIPLVREHDGVDVDLAHLPPDDPDGLRHAPARRHDRRLPGREPRADGDAAAHAAGALLRSRRRGGDHPSRADRRADGASVSRAAAPAASRCTYAHPVARADPEAHARRAALPGAAAAHGDGGRRLHRRRGRGAAPRDGLQALGGAHGARSRRGCAPAWRRAASPARPQDEIVHGITSFALYGFPESHAASFALIAYASAYLKAHHPAAFFCALLNNWPMGFYHPATLVKDAQRHGVRVPADRRDALGVAVHDRRTAPCASGCATSRGCGEDGAPSDCVAARPFASIGRASRSAAALRARRARGARARGRARRLRPHAARRALAGGGRRARRDAASLARRRGRRVRHGAAAGDDGVRGDRGRLRDDEPHRRPARHDATSRPACAARGVRTAAELRAASATALPCGSPAT